MNDQLLNNKILYVDDEQNLLYSFQSMLRKERYEVHLLQESGTIKEVLSKHGPFSVVISDQRMPKLDGVGVLEAVAQTHPNTVRIMMTGFSDYADTIRAINQGGIFQFIQKPWDDDTLKSIIKDSVTRYNLFEQNKILSNTIAEQNKDLTEVLHGTVSEIVRMLSDMLEHINPIASLQTARIRKLGTAMFDILPSIPEEDRWSIVQAFDLFNIGITVLPPWIQTTLNKDGLIALDRFPVAQNHYLLAHQLLKNIPRFEKTAEIILFCQKDFDGGGLPTDHPVHGKNIPLGSRILHILIDLEKLSTDNFKGKEVLKVMLQKHFKYDEDIIHALLGTQPAKTLHSKELEISIAELQPGMTVVDNITTKSNRLLLKFNSVISLSSLTLIQQWHTHDAINEPIRIRIEE